MTTLTVRPLRPALSLPPSLCPSQSRPAKLSLLIPASTEPNTLNVPSPSCRSSGTPIAGPKPKLSLSFGNDTRRTFTTSGSFSSSRLSCSMSPSDDDSTTSKEDITSRNTVVNTHIASAPYESEDSYRWTRSYSYTEVSGKRSILKGSPSHSEPKRCLFRSVSFEVEHVVIPSPCEEEEDYEAIPSPPSTTSSTDSEESESDSEPKTPVDDDDDRGRSFDRFASAAARSGKWRRPKREWVWTLGGSDSNDIMQELEYSSASLMQVEAI